MSDDFLYTDPNLQARRRTGADDAASMRNRLARGAAAASSSSSTPVVQRQGDLRDGEIRLDGPMNDPIGMIKSSQSLWYGTKYKVIIAHPTDATRGFLIRNGEEMSYADAEEALNNLMVNLRDRITRGRLDSRMYNDLRNTPKLLKSLVDSTNLRPNVASCVSPPQQPNVASSSSQDPSVIVASAPPPDPVVIAASTSAHPSSCDDHQDPPVFYPSVQAPSTGNADSAFPSPSAPAFDVARPSLNNAYGTACSSMSSPVISPPPPPPPQRPQASSSSTNAPPYQSVVEEDEESHDCPICFESIDPAEAVMRCNSTPCHFFHRSCLRQWIQQCRQNANHGGTLQATCPICRQGLSVHGGRLEDFLNGASSECLSDDDRSFLEKMLDKIPGRDDFTEICTLENLQYYGGIGIGISYGFYRGFSDRGDAASFGMALPLELAPARVQIATFGGFVAGKLVRLVKNYCEDKNSDRR